MHSEVQVLQYRVAESSLVLEQFARVRDSTENISYVSNESSCSVFPGQLLHVCSDAWFSVTLCGHRRRAL